MSNQFSQWFWRGAHWIWTSFARRPLLPLQYFEDVLAVEFRAINERRKEHGRPKVSPFAPPPARRPEPSLVRPRAPESKRSRKLSPDPRKLFASAADHVDAAVRIDALAQPRVDLRHPDYDKTRPQPVPCDANGLAFSGGGIRSAAVCLGVLQAIHARRLLESIDYLSTVSGGGYIGACLSAAMSTRGGGAFPFGDDVFDSIAVAHLRNYSNYLMPRGRSGVRNIAEAAAIILRGLLANFVIVLACLLGGALLTFVAYPDAGSLVRGSFAPRLIDGLLFHAIAVNDLVGEQPFRLTLCLIVLITAALVLWAVLRSRPWLDRYTDDADSDALRIARVLMIMTAVVAFLDLQPVAIAFTVHVHRYLEKELFSPAYLPTIVGALGAFSGAVSALSSFLGRFLTTSERATDWSTFALRIATQGLIFVAALVLPVAIWIAYLELSLWMMNGSVVLAAIAAFGVAALIMIALQANGYSLHRFYRDRLSEAFLFRAPKQGDDAVTSLDDLKLSELQGDVGPYHIVNSALNVEGSKEANRRGRNADFFMFTRDFVGSDLTHYARAHDMERIDPRLNLATAMAISGAAVSANMGSSTVRLLSPSLALLNIRLGYWLRNPLDLATKSGGALQRGLNGLLGKFYLLLEMLNQLDEASRNILLTDGGHIENLGIYELLKRGCQLVIVVDAEADPSMSFPSLLTLERYARIDLGVRIALPWEEIAAMTKSVDAHMDADRVCSNGPHCAIGRVTYETGAEGIIIYFKSSLTGDEKDYILDYKKRYPSFPHENTGDQFFTEEQFEVYRALGYHMVDGVFGGSDSFSFPSTGPGAFADRLAVIAAVRAMLGAATPEWVTP
ncbi:patatin-like phospholipase family protein [Methylocapsa sp. S129]|uniref:patatin-like phospholipase family protein n=1 Tax=Methylocapsa sp. S129 TaxID=1641869 RepID=UPI00131AF723|nr:patatin-like phospholipase family protein [Methylocapsa sp. S129]